MMQWPASVKSPVVALGTRYSGTRSGALRKLPVIDLYQHVTMALTGQWTADRTTHRLCMRWPPRLRGCRSGARWYRATLPMWVPPASSPVDDRGNGILATLCHFAASRHYPAAGLKSAGVVVDSVISGAGNWDREPLSSNATWTGDCTRLPHRPAWVGGHYLTVEVPEDTVVHQLPVALPDGRSV